jgi:hypothetical protein
MQLRSKNAFPTIKRLCFPRDPYKVVIKKSSVKCVEIRDASLPGYELGSRGIRLRVESSEMAIAE